MRWLLIDKFERIEKGKSARGIRNITRAEGALTDDYPAFPVMPPSLMLEMMAQVGGVLTGATVDFSKEVVLAKISSAEFVRRVMPPATLQIDAVLTEIGDSAAITECRITSDGVPVASAVIFFGLFAGLGEDGSGHVVFSRNFMESFAIRQTLAATAPGKVPA